MTTWAPDPHRGATAVRHRGRSWLSLRVELVQGRGERFWPRPGRLLAAARSHTFAQLATAIDDAFARWDRAHLHEFTLADSQRIGRPDPEFGTAEQVLDDQRTTLGRLRAAEQFVYVFDFGDDWTHLCTVGDRRIDPMEALGVLPAVPLPFFG
jgi:Plasmid pRiA4b ORF-3-like protein